MSATFEGFLRPDGTVGVRNYLLILSVNGLTGPSARRIGRAIAGAVVVTTPYGSGLLGEDAEAQTRTLVGLGRHPNVGAALVIGGHPPQVRAIADKIGAGGRRAEPLVLDECNHDALTLTDRGIRIAARFARELSRERRVTRRLSDLFVALECGRSDTSSGLVSNPLIGRFADRLVDDGGRVVFGETIEWLGAEAILAGRAAEQSVGERITSAVARREGLAVAAGMDLVGHNPGPTNIAAGLSTIEEKSLGSIAKAGSSIIRGVISFAEPPPGPGLYAMDGPAYAPESLTGMVAAGAQVVLFSTGVGNSFVSALAPTIKISGNPEAARHLQEQLDFDASAVFDGRTTPEAAADQLGELVLEVASGTMTWGEILGEGEEAVTRLGPTL